MKGFRDFITAASNDNHNFHHQMATPGIHPSVERWADRHTTAEEGSSVTTTAAYESYLNHSHKHGHEPLSLPTFKKQWLEYSGHMNQRIAGRERHIGMALKESLEEGIFGPHNAYKMWQAMAPHFAHHLHNNPGSPITLNAMQVDRRFPNLEVTVSPHSDQRKPTAHFIGSKIHDKPHKIHVRVGTNGFQLNSPEDHHNLLMQPGNVASFVHEHEHMIEFDEDMRSGYPMDKWYYAHAKSTKLKHSMQTGNYQDQLERYRDYVNTPTETRAHRVQLAVHAKLGGKIDHEENGAISAMNMRDPKHARSLDHSIVKSVMDRIGLRK